MSAEDGPTAASASNEQNTILGQKSPGWEQKDGAWPGGERLGDVCWRSLQKRQACYLYADSKISYTSSIR